MRRDAFRAANLVIDANRTILVGMRNVFAALIITLVCAPGALLAGSADHYVVINRDAQNTELHITLPASDIEKTLGVNSEIAFSENGTAPLRQFQETGSYDIADELIANVQLFGGNQKAEMEAMSLMVHPQSDPQRFQTPWDALLASSVCDADQLGAQLTPNSSNLYLSAFSHGLGAGESIQLTLPPTGRSEINLVVREFYESTFVGEKTYTVSDGGSIEILPTSPSLFSRMSEFAAYFSIALSTLFLGIAARFG